MNTVTREATIKTGFCLPCQHTPILRGKNLLMWSKFFTLRVYPIFERALCTAKQNGIHKSYLPLLNIGENVSEVKQAVVHPASNVVVRWLTYLPRSSYKSVSNPCCGNGIFRMPAKFLSLIFFFFFYF